MNDRRAKASASIRELLITGLLAIGLFWVLQAFVVGTYRVDGHSMDRTLANDQRLLVDKLTPRFMPYSRGDIVVLRPPASEHTDIPYIKRVIGIAGDHVEISDGQVVVNGTVLDEPYVPAGSVTIPTGGVSSWDIDPGKVLVMGDNREHSQDGRVFGEIPVASIIGRAWLRFWPLDAFGLV